MAWIKASRGGRQKVKSGVDATICNFYHSWILFKTFNIFFLSSNFFLFDFSGTLPETNPITIWLSSYLRNSSAIFCSIFSILMISLKNANKS